MYTLTNEEKAFCRTADITEQQFAEQRAVELGLDDDALAAAAAAQGLDATETRVVALLGVTPSEYAAEKAKIVAERQSRLGQ